MATKLTPVGWIAKFLVAPAAMAAIGYYFVGPRIGATSPANAKPAEEQASPQIDAPTTEEAPAVPPPATAHKPTPPAPDVSVSVRPVDKAQPELGGDADVQTTDDDKPTDDPKPRQRPVTSNGG